MSTLASVIMEGVVASLPAASIPGRIYFATDTHKTYRDTGTTWDDVSDTSAPSGAAGGDLSGTYPNPGVSKVNGGAVPVSAALVGTNSSGQLVVGTGGGVASVTATAPIVSSGGANPVITANTATSTSKGVVKADGTSVAVDGAGNLTTVGAPPTGAAGGDLSGSYPSPSVSKVNGGTVPVSAAVVGTDSSGRFTSNTSIATQSSVQQESLVYSADTGTANSYIVTLSPVPTIIAGSEVVFKAANTNTGASTVTVNGTSYPLLKNGTTPLVGGEIVVGQIITGKCDGTNFQITSATIGANAVAVTSTAVAASVNLTTQGTFDWFAPNSTTTLPRGLAATLLHAKVGGKTGGQIYNSFEWVAGGNTVTVFTQAAGNTMSSTGSDDLAQAALSSSTGAQGIFSATAGALNYGYRLAVPVSPTSRTLKLYTSLFSGTATCTASFSDGSVTPGTATLVTTAGAGLDGAFTISFQGAGYGAMMFVTVLLTTNLGSSPGVRFQAATLA